MRSFIVPHLEHFLKKEPNPHDEHGKPAALAMPPALAMPKPSCCICFACLGLSTLINPLLSALYIFVPRSVLTDTSFNPCGGITLGIWFPSVA
jgi:hypothetical protein